MKRENIWLMASCLLIVALVVASCTPRVEKVEEKALEKESPVEKLQILSHSMRLEESVEGKGLSGIFVVEGTAKNITSSILNRAEIRVIFYDWGGAIISKPLTFIEGLGPGEIWNWKVNLPQNLLSTGGATGRQSGAEKAGIQRYEVEVGLVY